jgi:hypothetical protein
LRDEFSRWAMSRDEFLRRAMSRDVFSRCAMSYDAAQQNYKQSDLCVTHHHAIGFRCSCKQALKDCLPEKGLDFSQQTIYLIILYVQRYEESSFLNTFHK